MLNLKAELLKKKQDFEKEKNKTDKTYITSKDKIVITKKPLPWNKKNSGVEKRNERDQELEEEQVDKLSKVQSILEAKAKMYDKMTSGNVIPDEETSQLFLVDFEQKAIDSWRKKREAGDNISKPEVNVKVINEVKETINDAKSQWVDYVDALGRTRTCLKEDLHKFQKMDEKLAPAEHQTSTRDLMSDDMRREEERRKWEEEAQEEVEAGPVHFENVRFGEKRELGVGYYAFSQEAEKRKEQLQRLNKAREDTVKQKQANLAKKQKEKIALQARLEKVRQRRIKQLQIQGKDIPASLLEPVKLEEEEKEETKEIKEEEQKIESEKPEPKLPYKLREWDKDKETIWAPAAPPKVPKSWKDPREERLDEFAPPSSYFNERNARKRPLSDATDTSKYPKPDHEPHDKQSFAQPQSSTSSTLPNPDEIRIQRLMDEITVKHTKKAGLDSKKAEPVAKEVKVEVKPDISDTKEPELKPFVPPSKPISISVKSKPSTKLTSKSALSD
uniref:Coiled-coil domain-containing protein 174-like n=1 Tax=Phallusia mammillata TaxID=59560 RepID=A0A6F9D932_9ASCI|nr:coiled-coil domain-containing protein 174-like [Phallusia mammillata]